VEEETTIQEGNNNNHESQRAPIATPKQVNTIEEISQEGIYTM
jgi:hypothetical protein